MGDISDELDEMFAEHWEELSMAEGEAKAGNFVSKTCPRCEEPTEPVDHFPVEGGGAWHVGCYQASTVEAGEPDPFPLCDYCEQLVWETEPVVHGQIIERGEWRPARFHAECAPGAPEAPDRVDEPKLASAFRYLLAPELDKMIDDLKSFEPIVTPGNDSAPYLTAEPGITIHRDVQQSDLATIPKLGDPCAGCAKPVKRAIQIADGKAWHFNCLQKAAKARRKATKRAPRTCAVCAKTIGPRIHDDQVVEWDGASGAEYAHRKCYRKATVLAGAPDPFPEDPPLRGVNPDALPGETKDNPAIPCGICENLGRPGTRVLRSEFREHVAAHEQAQWSA